MVKVLAMPFDAAVLSIRIDPTVSSKQFALLSIMMMMRPPQFTTKTSAYLSKRRTSLCSQGGSPMYDVATMISGS